MPGTIVDYTGDTLTPQQRSERMARVKCMDSKAEMAVRRLIHSMGYRYRLHVAQLPGRPDLVFTSRRKIIFVHGCFWHRHVGCSRCRLPKSRIDFWQPKLEGNRQRDITIQANLKLAGWDVMVVWECEISEREALTRRCMDFLEGTT